MLGQVVISGNTGRRGSWRCGLARALGVPAEEVPLRPYLRSDADARAIGPLVRAAVAEKPASHSLRNGSPGATSTLAAIGG